MNNFYKCPYKKLQCRRISFFIVSFVCCLTGFWNFPFRFLTLLVFRKLFGSCMNVLRFSSVRTYPETYESFLVFVLHFRFRLNQHLTDLLTTSTRGGMCVRGAVSDPLNDQGSPILSETGY